METTINTTSEPSILTANTFYWTPSGSASSRRSSEQRKIAEVAAFFQAQGFSVETKSNGNYDLVVAKKADVEVVFSYWESCHNVYKKLSVTRGGKNSNVKGLRKYYAA